MKTSAEYLKNIIISVNENTSVITYDDALQAIETALADAAEYKYLLLRALRHQTNSAELNRPSGEATILPLSVAMSDLPVAA